MVTVIAASLPSFETRTPSVVVPALHPLLQAGDALGGRQSSVDELLRDEGVVLVGDVVPVHEALDLPQGAFVGSEEPLARDLGRVPRDLVREARVPAEALAQRLARAQQRHEGLAVIEVVDPHAPQVVHDLGRLLGAQPEQPRHLPDGQAAVEVRDLVLQLLDVSQRVEAVDVGGLYADEHGVARAEIGLAVVQLREGPRPVGLREQHPLDVVVDGEPRNAPRQYRGDDRRGDQDRPGPTVGSGAALEELF